MRQQEHYHHKS